MQTVYISDLDGTLLDENGHLSVYTEAVLKKLYQKQILFSVATARSPISAAPILEGVPFRIPVILMNGVFLYDLAAKQAISFAEIRPCAFTDTLAAFDALSVAPMVFLYGDDGAFSMHYTRLPENILPDFYEARRKSLGERFCCVRQLQIPAGQHAVYINAVHTHETLQPLAERLKTVAGIQFSFYPDAYSPFWFLEVYSENASKAHAAEALRKRVGAQKIVAFGDNYNDLPLFAAADAAYAVENAVPAVKEQATAVLQSNRENGVAKFLERTHLSI